MRAGSAGTQGQAASESEAMSSISSTPRAPPDEVSTGGPSKREAAAAAAPREAAAPPGTQAQALGKRTVAADKGPASSIVQEPPPPNAHGSQRGSALPCARLVRLRRVCGRHQPVASTTRVAGCWRKADSASCLQGLERACLGARASTLPTLLAISGISCRYCACTEWGAARSTHDTLCVQMMGTSSVGLSIICTQSLCWCACLGADARASALCLRVKGLGP